MVVGLLSSELSRVGSYSFWISVVWVNLDSAWPAILCLVPHRRWARHGFRQLCTVQKNMEKQLWANVLLILQSRRLGRRAPTHFSLDFISPASSGKNIAKQESMSIATPRETLSSCWLPGTVLGSGIGLGGWHVVGQSIRVA